VGEGRMRGCMLMAGAWGSARFSTGSSAVNGSSDIPSRAIVQTERIMARNLTRLYQHITFSVHTQFQNLDSAYGFPKSFTGSLLGRYMCAIFECAATDSCCNPRTVLFFSFPRQSPHLHSR